LPGVRAASSVEEIVIRHSFVLSFALLVLALSGCSARTPVAAPATSAPPVATPTASGAQGDATPAPGASASGAPAASCASSAKPVPPKAAPTVPPARGTYTYSQEGSAKAAGFSLPSDPSGTLDVEAPADAPGGKRQKQTRTISSQESREQTLIFTPDAVLLEQTVSNFGGQSASCKTAKPLRIVLLPLVVGNSWSDRGTCSGGSISFTAKVERAEDRTIGGARVHTFVVHHVFQIVNGGDRQDVDLTSWLSPDYRLDVRSVQHATGTVQGTPFTEDMTDELQSLSPAQ
jgi:hypothetical protein